VPFVSKACLLKKLSLKMENSFEAHQILLSAHTVKSPVLPVLKVELAGFWEALGLNNMPKKKKKTACFLFAWV